MAINATQRMASVVFIDGSLPDLQTILSGLDPSVTAIVLDPAQDGIQQMADALAGVSGLDAIHIISHGSSGQINLGTAQLSQDTLAQYQTQLAIIGNALSTTGDFLLYGCNVAQGDAGQTFISALASATGADVAASTDLTGATSLGGNWVLEQSTGYVDVAAIQCVPLADYLTFKRGQKSCLPAPKYNSHRCRTLPRCIASAPTSRYRFHADEVEVDQQSVV